MVKYNRQLIIDIDKMSLIEFDELRNEESRNANLTTHVKFNVLFLPFHISAVMFAVKMQFLICK